MLGQHPGMADLAGVHRLETLADGSYPDELLEHAQSVPGRLAFSKPQQRS
jgi:hypothetical protein